MGMGWREGLNFLLREKILKTSKHHDHMVTARNFELSIHFESYPASNHPSKIFSRTTSSYSVIITQVPYLF